MEKHPSFRPDETFSAVALGSNHSCALREDGPAFCWGSNFLSGNHHFSGQAIAPYGEQFTAIAVGYVHTCALRMDGTPVCWGAGYPINLDNHATFLDIAGESFSSISSGTDHVCALRSDGRAVCWGDNLDGKAAPPSEQFLAISSGTNHTCALRARTPPPYAGAATLPLSDMKMTTRARRRRSTESHSSPSAVACSTPAR